MKKIAILFLSILFGYASHAQFYKVSLVKDINPGATGSAPSELTYCNGKLYFASNNGTVGNELWRSDGTSAGTALLMDINNTGISSSNPSKLTAVNFNVYFAANDGTHGQELWRYQTGGAGMGTYLVKDINPNGTTGSNPLWLTNLNGTLVFIADDGAVGFELWKSNGTAASTVLVKDIWAIGRISSSPRNLTVCNNSVFFVAESSSSSPYLYKYDLSNVEFQTISSQNPSAFNALNLTNSNETLFMNGNGTSGPIGKELFKKTASADVVLVKDIYPGTADGAGNSSAPDNLTDVNGTLFFAAITGNTRSLWKSNGTAAGTVIVKSIPGDEDFSNLCNVNGILYFTVTSTANGNELWKSDGTTPGTVLVKDIVAGTGSSAPGDFINFNGTLYFSADDGIHGRELWRSDGSDGGTYMVADINDGIGNSDPARFCVADDELFFSADDGIHGKELWKVKNCAAVSIATASSASITQDVINPSFYNGENCNNLIAKVEQNGIVSGITTAKVWNETVQPLEYVKRHYEILPVNNAATSTARVTLYFTDAEFSAFNMQATPPALLLPLSTGTNAEIEERKNNLRIEKRLGSSSNGSGLPVTYAGIVETIDPPEYDIVWSIGRNRWEISFFSNGFGGYFLKTRTSAIAGTYTFTGNGNWSEPANWEYGAVPPANLSRGSQIIINPATGSCILNVPYTVKPFVQLTVYPGKKLDVLGNLTINSQLSPTLHF